MKTGCHSNRSTLLAKRCAMIRCFVFAVVAVIGMDSIAFQEPDPIQTQIQLAKDKYDLAIGNGSDLLVEQMDKKIQEVADSGDLKNVKFLVAEKKAFQKMAKLPESQTLKEEVEEFKTVLFKASTDLVEAYKIAIKQQTKLLKIDEADALVSEMEAFEAKSITSRPTKIDDGPTELRIETAKKRFIAEVASAKAAYDKKVAEAESLLEKVFDEEAGKQQDKNVGKKILAQKEQYLVDSYSKNMKLVPTSKDEVFAEIISALNSGTWRCHWEEGSPFQGPYTFNVNRKGIDVKNQIRVRSMFVVQYQDNSFFIYKNGKFQGFHEPTGRQFSFLR